MPDALSPILNSFLSLALTALVAAFVVPAIPPAIAWLRAQKKMAEASKYGVQVRLVEQTIRSLVAAAEQSGLAGQIENTGKAKKAYVLGLAETWLQHYGLDIDLHALDAMVEAEVNMTFPKTISASEAAVSGMVTLTANTTSGPVALRPDLQPSATTVLGYGALANSAVLQPQVTNSALAAPAPESKAQS